MTIEQALDTLGLTETQFLAMTAEDLAALVDDSASLEAVKILLATRNA